MVPPPDSPYSSHCRGGPGFPFTKVDMASPQPFTSLKGMGLNECVREACWWVSGPQDVMETSSV